MIGESTRRFRQLVDQKGRDLRKLSYDEILKLASTPTEEVEFSGRRGTISLIVEECPGERLKVIVQGFLNGRLLRFVKSVGLDGFYKHRDGSVGPMEPEEFYDYD